MQRDVKEAGPASGRERVRARRRSSRRWKLEGVGGRRKGEKRERERDTVRQDFSPFDGEETERRRPGEKPGRLHGAAEKVANSKTFRGPIISDETTVRHQGGCPVYLDL